MTKNVGVNEKIISMRDMTGVINNMNIRISSKREEAAKKRMEAELLIREAEGLEYGMQMLLDKVREIGK